METPQTCGRGLAEHSALPTKLAELTANVAENLEVHMTALDLDDEDARREHGVYEKLTLAHRDLAERLRATGEEMAASRDLPMGRHDEAALSSPKILEVFQRMVQTERELLGLLQTRVEQHQQMLAQARGAAETGQG
jgi:hypothetical protein